ncbi:hypothetical protein D3C75_952890 [compost metagenome]
MLIAPARLKVCTPIAALDDIKTWSQTWARFPDIAKIGAETGGPARNRSQIIGRAELCALPGDVGDVTATDADDVRPLKREMAVVQEQASGQIQRRSGRPGRLSLDEAHLAIADIASDEVPPRRDDVRLNVTPVHPADRGLGGPGRGLSGSKAAFKQSEAIGATSLQVACIFADAAGPRSPVKTQKDRRSTARRPPQGGRGAKKGL